MHTHTHTHTHTTHTYIYICIYTYLNKKWIGPQRNSHTHTHTHTYIYIYIYICCVNLYISVTSLIIWIHLVLDLCFKLTFWLNNHVFFSVDIMALLACRESLFVSSAMWPVPQWMSVIRKLRVILLTAVCPDVERPRVEGEGRAEGLEQMT